MLNFRWERDVLKRMGYHLFSYVTRDGRTFIAKIRRGGTFNALTVFTLDGEQHYSITYRDEGQIPLEDELLERAGYVPKHVDWK